MTGLIRITWVNRMTRMTGVTRLIGVTKGGFQKSDLAGQPMAGPVI